MQGGGPAITDKSKEYCMFLFMIFSVPFFWYVTIQAMSLLSTHFLGEILPENWGKSISDLYGRVR